MSLEPKLCPACLRFFDPEIPGQVVCHKSDCALIQTSLRIPKRHLRFLSQTYGRVVDGVRAAIVELLQKFNLRPQVYIEEGEMQKLNVYLPEGLANLVRRDEDFPTISAAIRHTIAVYYNAKPKREGEQ